jgi:hypothetical protein
MRYTHLGVGHPVMLRRMTRDCLDSESVTPVNAMDVVNEDDDTDDIDVEDRESCHDVQEEDHDSGSEDEDEGDGEDDEDSGDDGEDGEGEDIFDVSF